MCHIFERDSIEAEGDIPEVDKRNQSGGGRTNPRNLDPTEKHENYKKAWILFLRISDHEPRLTDVLKTL